MMRFSQVRSLLTAAVLAVSFGSAWAKPSPVTLKGAPTDQVEIEFLRAQTVFADALVVTNPGTTLGDCVFLNDATGNAIQHCFFEGTKCSDPPNSVSADDADGPCEQPSAGEFTCECHAHFSTTIGTIEQLAGSPGAKSAAVGLQLVVDKTRGPDWTVDETLDSDPGHLRRTQLGPNEWLLEWEDRPVGGDKDFNDFVAVIRAVPAH